MFFIERERDVDFGLNNSLKDVRFVGRCVGVWLGVARDWRGTGVGNKAKMRDISANTKIRDRVGKKVWYFFHKAENIKGVHTFKWY